jgi:hypothetical protein
MTPPKLSQLGLECTESRAVECDEFLAPSAIGPAGVCRRACSDPHSSMPHASIGPAEPQSAALSRALALAGQPQGAHVARVSSGSAARSNGRRLHACAAGLYHFLIANTASIPSQLLVVLTTQWLRDLIQDLFHRAPARAGGRNGPVPGALLFAGEPGSEAGPLPGRDSEAATQWHFQVGVTVESDSDSDSEP